MVKAQAITFRKLLQTSVTDMKKFKISGIFKINNSRSVMKSALEPHRRTENVAFDVIELINSYFIFKSFRLSDYIENLL
jgi:hypothetical protein